MKKILIATILIVITALFGVVYYNNFKKIDLPPENIDDMKSVMEEMESEMDEHMEEMMGNSYLLSEVALHNSKDNCWLAIEGKVYDVTKFIPTHPGGDAILAGCGKDATELFNTRPMGSGTPHSERARNGLENYYIGELRK